MDALLAVLAESQTEGLTGAELLEAVAVVWFDYRNQSLNDEMSLAADAKIVWGGAEAVRAVSRLPRREHCVEIIFGPKYSIGVIGRRLLDAEDDAALDSVVAALVRDMATFDQRACSAPQTVFVERSERRSEEMGTGSEPCCKNAVPEACREVPVPISSALRELGERFARHFARLPPKTELDAYTTLRILDVRARWAIDAAKDVIASADGAQWTVCMDRRWS